MLTYIRRLPNAFIWSALALSVLLAGCGGSSTTTTGPKPVIVVQSPVVTGGQELPARYTCDGKNLSLPLIWQGVPQGTVELAVIIAAIGEQNKLSPQWGVAHIRPKVTQLTVGKLPADAIVGSGETGKAKYSLCPAKGFRTTYLVFVYALPRSFALRPGYKVLDLLGSANSVAAAYGQLTFTYTRH